MISTLKCIHTSNDGEHERVFGMRIILLQCSLCLDKKHFESWWEGKQSFCPVFFLSLSLG